MKDKNDEQTKRIINFDALDKPIIEIENIMKAYNHEENALILKVITDRFNRKAQEIKAGEISSNVLKKMPFGHLLFGDEKEN